MILCFVCCEGVWHWSVNTRDLHNKRQWANKSIVFFWCVVLRKLRHSVCLVSTTKTMCVCVHHTHTNACWKAFSQSDALFQCWANNNRTRHAVLLYALLRGWQMCEMVCVCVCVFALTPPPITTFHPPLFNMQCRYLVDPASSHMLVSKIKPCMSEFKQL